MSSAPERTTLFECHRDLGARFTPFAGWEMPVQYAGVLAEHRAVRQAAGLFDVSHMGEIEVSGGGALAFLEWMTPNRVASLRAGQAQYTALLSEQGTFIDDLLVYRLGDQRFLLVVNAANRKKDLDWLEAHARPAAQLRDVSAGFGLLALQGPMGARIIERLFGQIPARLQPFHFVEFPHEGKTILISRTGYTGEDGFELYIPPAQACDLWTRLLEEGRPGGLQPVGLGARDTLRLEAALCLYGHDIDSTVTPWEAGLSFIVKMDKGDFIGRKALELQKKDGVRRRLAGLVMEGRGVPRPGYKVLCAGNPCGEVTSGTHSPTLGKGIALAYLPTEVRQEPLEFAIVIRERAVEARVVSLPFYRRARG
ncbi:MAG: glycine cleavage system aminomethyltransferase GcvT [Acidobacteriota bacterium]